MHCSSARVWPAKAPSVTICSDPHYIVGMRGRPGGEARAPTRAPGSGPRRAGPEPAPRPCFPKPVPPARASGPGAGAWVRARGPGPCPPGPVQGLGLGFQNPPNSPEKLGWGGVP